MAEMTVTVSNKTGLHARPAALFVQKAKEHTSDILVLKDGKAVSAKSILGILSLNVNQGSVITIRAEGEDAAEAVVALGQLIQSFCDN